MKAEIRNNILWVIAEDYSDECQLLSMITQEFCIVCKAKLPIKIDRSSYKLYKNPLEK